METACTSYSFRGIRQADRVGPACWQARNSDTSLYARGNLNRSEDCLYLNVFTGAENPNEDLPVMVWFHGGGNTAGHGGPLIFDGSNLAERGAVIVTANYRLGAFGFLAHSALTSESEQNTSGMTAFSIRWKCCNGCKIILEVLVAIQIGSLSLASQPVEPMFAYLCHRHWQKD
ncbi:MAG: hypothetical protein CM1200mP40_33250 [Gammaproteobacteria bacterium]|nr:MAG: hypothetical protein CM1200mP40_33250 [Gammaproteobacteria bacterium]